MGVRNTWPAMVRRAASMSPIVMLMPYLSPPLGESAVSHGALDRILEHKAALELHLANGRASCAKTIYAAFRRWNWSIARIESEDRERGHLVMTDGGQRKIGVSIDVKPHAYDPAANPELFEGVLARRCIAFVIDVIIIAIPVLFAAVFIFIFGLITLGLGWVLFWLLSPATVIWAICYYGLTFGSPASATIGMRVMDIEMRTW